MFEMFLFIKYTIYKYLFSWIKKQKEQKLKFYV